MMYFDNEDNIIKQFQSEFSQDCLLLGRKGLDDAEFIFQQMYNKDLWSNWTASAGKNDPPPDYYNEELKLMMDVMRVDDIGRTVMKGRKAKIYNPAKQLESKRIKELVDAIPQLKAENIIYSGDGPDLDTDDYHNYMFYITEFKRIVTEHNSKIKREYLKNHQGFKTILFIYDESCGYIKYIGDINESRKNNIIKGQPHMHWLDANFINVLRKLDADYVVWYTPFKLYNFMGIAKPGNHPRVVFYDLTNKHDISVMKNNSILYPIRDMTPNER